MGRPTDMTADTVTKLVAAFNNGFNISEACSYAGIARLTYYRWLEADENFSNKMIEAQQAPNKKAKEVVIRAIDDGDANLAFRYLQARDPDFKAKGEIEVNHDLSKTREKLREFLDDTDDGAYNDAGEQPITAIEPTATDEVAPSSTDIS